MTGVSGIFARRSLLRLKKCSGFTIVETMIVLAVTGALFIAIAVSLSGKQNEAEFTHAVQSIQSQIQQVVDQTSAGFYPNNANFTCTANGNTIQFSSGSNTQGTNQGCVFLGKVMQFHTQGTNPENYQTYTVAGLRTATAGAGSPFQNSDAKVVGVGANYTSYSTPASLEYGLTTAWMKAGATNIGAVGFLMEPGSLTTSTTSGYSSGAQQVDLVPLPGTALNQSITQAVTAINNTLIDPNLSADAPINPSSGVQICFVSAGTNQSGLVNIGGSGRQLLVTLSIKGDRICQ